MIYELTIEDDNDEVFAISLVETPAIESNFIYFNRDKVEFAAVSTEKRLVMGPILIPDKQIIRMDGEGKPYWVFFRAETVEKLAQNYLLKGYNSETTLEHDGKVDDVSLVESWIVQSRTKDKSANYNLSLPAGSWVGIFKVNNDEVWDEYVKTGKVKGFSVEGLFNHKLVSASKEVDFMDKDIDELTEDEAKALLHHIHSLLMPSVEMEIPSITSTYPGEPATGSISEETL